MFYCCLTVRRHMWWDLIRDDQETVYDCANEGHFDGKNGCWTHSVSNTVHSNGYYCNSHRDINRSLDLLQKCVKCALKISPVVWRLLSTLLCFLRDELLRLPRLSENILIICPRMFSMIIYLSNVCLEVKHYRYCDKIVEKTSPCIEI